MSTYDKLRQGQIPPHLRSIIPFLKKSMLTAGVGEIASVEEHLGFLWGHGQDKTPEQQKIFEIWQVCREEMFDKVNFQLRSLLKKLGEGK